ncbi:O-antigen/teichoic acid export membrane protein [Terracoccus luteus]|uniref:O-antigen/teichoic acid export membrane protein n=1 Tax=Terracoccus luteus TaxID=53356 RepID=A0A495Y0Q0_9MICO|nr:hypothetical protein [Terracoccus luteus]RKT79772.1 O-antigen/teichoic acid export membrane protein [Terracoccus luteus]
MTTARRGGVLAVATGSAGQLGLAAVANLATSATLPADERGRYVFLVTALALTAPLAGLGSSVGLRRLLPHSDHPGALEHAYLRLTLGCAVAHGVLASAVLGLLGVADAVGGLRDAAAVAALGTGLVLTAQLVELWFARSDFRTGAVYATANALTTVAAAVATLITPTFGAAVTTQAGAMLTVNVVQLLHLRGRRAGEARPAREVPTGDVATGPPSARTLVRVGAPSLVLTGGLALAFRLDRILLGVIVGPVAVSVYSLAGSFAEMPRFVPASFGQVAYAEAANDRGRTPVRPHLVRAYRWSLPAVALAAVAGLLFVHAVDPVYLGAVVPLLLLLVGELLLVPFDVVMRMVLGGGRVGLSAVVGAGALVASAGVYWVAITVGGMLGAAVASLLVYAGVSAACLLLYRSRPPEMSTVSSVAASLTGTEHHPATKEGTDGRTVAAP